MEEIKKIIAKASYGQDTQSFSKSIFISTYDKKKPVEVLGCIITDAEILSSTLEENVKKGKGVRVNGKFNVHLWYGQSGDTKVAKVGANFSDVVVIDAKGAEKFSGEEVKAWIKSAPKFSKATISESADEPGVSVLAEYSLGAEIVGLTTLNVKVIKYEDNIDADESDAIGDGDAADEYEDD